MSRSSPLPESSPLAPSDGPDRPPDARIVLTELGRIKTLSDGARPLLQGRAADCRGRPVAEVLPDPMGSRVEAVVRHAVQERTATTVEAFHPATRRWFEVQARPDSTGVSLLFRDRTPQTQCAHLLHLLDATVLEGLWRTGPDGTVFTANAAFARFLGYPESSALEGRRARTLFADPAVWPRLRETVVAQGPVDDLVCTYRRKDGTEAKGRTHLTPLRTGDGTVRGMAVSVIETAPDDEAPPQRGLIERAVEATTEAIAITEPAPAEPTEAPIVYVNPAFTDLTGYPAAAATDESIDVLFGSATAPDTRDVLRRRLRDGRPFRGTVQARRRDGTPWTGPWSVAPIRAADGTIAHWVWVLRNDGPHRTGPVVSSEATADVFDGMDPLLEATTPQQVATGLVQMVTEAFPDTRVVVRRVADETLTVLAATDAVSTDTVLPLAGSHPAARAAASADLVVDDAHLHAPLGDHGVLSIDVSATDSSPPFRLLDQLARHAATVLDRIARAADQSTAHRRCEALRAAGRALLAAGSVPAGAAHAMDALAPLLPTPLRFCLCHLAESDEEASVVGASTPPLPGLAPGDVLPVDDRLHRLVDANTLQTLSDAFPSSIEDALERAGCRSALLVPLPADAARGLLLLATEAEDAFGRAHHALAEEAAALFGEALSPTTGTTVRADPPSTKSAFLANLHHELRTPLTSIIGFAEVLQTDSGTASDRFAALIARSGRRLQDTFDDLITLSQLEAGSRSLDPEPLSVTSQIQMAVDAAQDRAREAGLSLSTEGLDRSVEAVLDRDGLHDILGALLDNALTFTETGGVTVRLHVDDTTLRVEVADTGVGMPPDRVPALFEPFRQAPTDDGPTPEGSGLGLALVQGWVDALGGTVDVDTTPGTGTVVTVRLPR